MGFELYTKDPIWLRIYWNWSMNLNVNSQLLEVTVGYLHVSANMQKFINLV